MDTDDLAPRLCTALMRVGTRMAAGFDQHFARFGVTQAQFRVLLLLGESGGEQGIAPSVLADRLLIERATVSVLTTRMIARGWLARTPGENRRTFRLVLTPTGEQLLQQMKPHAVALADKTLAALHPAELQGLRSALETLEAHLRDGDPPSQLPILLEEL